MQSAAQRRARGEEPEQADLAQKHVLEEFSESGKLRFSE